MRIYLAGPMRGLPDLNFPAFHAAAAKLREMGHEVFNPAEEDQGNIRDGLAVDLAWICREAEALVLLDGWHKSAGVRAEIAAAQAVGIPVKKAWQMGVLA